jgi:zinc protease
MMRISRHNARSPVSLLAGLVSVALCHAACQSSARAPDIIPALPGEGTAHTARPGEGTAEPPEEQDPWAERDDLIAPPEPMTAARLELPPIERFTLKNGLQVIAVRSPALPVVHMNLAIKAGRADVTRDKVGLADFVAAMLTRGTRTSSAQKIVQTVDGAAASLGTDASLEAVLLTCSVMSKSLRTCSTLLSDLARNPTFPAADMNEVSQRLVREVRQRRADLGQLANDHLQNLLFGEDHVRGWPISERTIAAIERKDLQAWHRTWFVPNNAVLTVAGEFDPKALRAELERAFRPWPRGKVPARAGQPAPELGGVKIRLVDAPGQPQAQIRIGQPGVAHADPVFFDLLVLNQVLGGGLTPRAAQVLRAQLGKPYDAASAFDRNRERGALVISTATVNGDVRPAIELLAREMARMKESGARPEEVRDAATFLMGASAVRFGSVADLANALLAAELHGLGVEYVRDYQLAVAKVTAETAAKAASRVLNPQKLAIVIAGDAREIAPQLDKAGWAYETIRSISPITRHERENRDPGPVSAGAEAAGRALLDQALKATGGAAKLGQIKSLAMHAKGKIAIQDRELPAKFIRRFQAPDKLRMDIELDLGGGSAQVVTLLNGNQAWNKQPGQGVVALPPDAVAELRKQIWRGQEFILLRHREPGARVESLGEKTVDGRAFDVVRVGSADGAVSATLYLDKKTRLVASMTYAEDGVESVEVYGDYKAVDGVQVAHRRQTRSMDAVLSIEVTSVVFNQPMDASLFAEPR